MTAARRFATMLLGLVSAAAIAAPEQPDPYLWLEAVSGPRALAWVASENKRSLGILEADPRFTGFLADATRIAEAADRIPAPSMISGQVTNFWQDADHVRGLWRVTTPASYASAAPAWRTLIDLDALSAAEHANWVWHGAECEPVVERRCLIRLSDGGEDAETEREFDLATGRFVPAGFALPTSKQNAAWESGDSLLVARDWGKGTMTASGYPYVVKRLLRGQPLAAATELFRGQANDVGVSVHSFADGSGRRIAVVQREITFFETEYRVVAGNHLIPLDLPRKADLRGFVAGRLIFQVNEGWAPRDTGAVPAGALVAVDSDGRAAPETILVPSARQFVDDVATSRDHVLAAVYDEVRGRALSFTPDAGHWRPQTVTLPDNAAIDLASTDRATNDAYIGVQSFLLPPSMYAVNAASGAARQVKTTPPRFDATGLVTEQFFARSTDGTHVPYFVVHRRGQALDGQTPTLMTAYGGFQVSETPRYSGVTGKLWLERGGAFVLANIRGGGEFGPAWHEAALKTKRQNAYDDFAAVARDLFARRFTSPRRLGIYGGSNGGLLMGVELTEHPELWNAVAIEVPLLDMLRYEKLSAGASWVGEYGTVVNPVERDFLARISPYNNLKRDVAYPEPFIWTTTKDDRVGPVQARKFAARMKEYGLPYLYWENTEGGHGAGANLKEQAKARALEMTYFIRRLG